MKNLFLIIFMLLTIGIAKGQNVISTGADIATGLANKGLPARIISLNNETAILDVNDNTIREVIKLAHEEGRCGGFFYHENITEARNTVKPVKTKTNPLVIKDLRIVKGMTSAVEEKNIKEFIEKLSSYNNRYYQSDTGVEAANTIKDQWQKYTPTEIYPHKNWKQPSVIATIKGSKYPDKIIVLGGHLDSIAGFFGGSTARAPGADDNASGIATITEVLRVITTSKYQPLHTIQFMGYAAEEVGLRGSNEIARDYKARGVEVLGVMQLDMTNFKGSKETIFLTEDYTDAGHTTFLAGLVDTYLKVPYARTTCGYACSDHASWNKAGYPAAFPFEASKNDMNRNIHTAKDTLAVSGDNANHAVNFARLALAYLVELDLQSVNVSSKGVDL